MTAASAAQRAVCRKTRRPELKQMPPMRSLLLIMMSPVAEYLVTTANCNLGQVPSSFPNEAPMTFRRRGASSVDLIKLCF